MTADIVRLPTAASRPVGAQRVRGAAPAGVIPAPRLVKLRRERVLRAGALSRLQARKKNDRQRELVAVLDELRQAAVDGELEGVIFIVSLDKDEWAGASGCYRVADKRQTETQVL